MPLVTVASPFVCWGYVLVGWSLGATVGMRLVGITLITETGDRVNAQIAFRRMVGFWLACLPVKIGLLPIFFDERRQGWHDRVARTIVVKMGYDAPLPDRAPQPPLPSPTVPDMRVPWRGAPLAVALYAALAVAMTWPTVLHMSSRVMGYPNDPYILLWNYSFFNQAVATHASPLTTNLIFHPRRVWLALHTMQWFNCALAVPLLRHFSLAGVYNLLNLFSLAATAFGAYWFIAAMTRSRISALVGGAAFGFSPYIMAHALGHANLIAAEFLPAYTLCAYAALVTRRARYAVWSGVWMCLAGLCDLQYLAFCALIGIALFAGLGLLYERPDGSGMWRRVAMIGAGFAVAGTLLLPVIVPAALAMRGGAMDKTHVAGLFRADLVDWIRPGMLAKLALPHIVSRASVENSVSPGIVLLALAAVAIATQWRAVRLWGLMAVVFGILASGPYLTVGGHQLTLAGYFLLGFPGTGFRLPWDASDMLVRASTLLASPSDTLNLTTAISLPFAWLPTLLPMLKSFRVPVRLGIVADMSVAVLAAYGLAALLAVPRPRLRSIAIASVVAASVFAESFVAPYPSFAPPRLEAYRSLGRVPGREAVIEIPCRGNELSAYGQTLHHRPLFKSFVSRCPVGLMREVDRNYVLANCQTIEDITGDPRGVAALDELKRLGAGYIAVHRNTDQPPHSTKPTQSYPIAFQDATISIYDVR